METINWSRTGANASNCPSASQPLVLSDVIAPPAWALARSAGASSRNNASPPLKLARTMPAASSWSMARSKAAVSISRSAAAGTSQYWQRRLQRWVRMKVMDSGVGRPLARVEAMRSPRLSVSRAARARPLILRSRRGRRSPATRRKPSPATDGFDATSQGRRNGHGRARRC